MSIKGTMYVPIAAQGRDNIASQKAETGCLGYRKCLLKKTKYSDEEHGNNLLRYPFPLRLTSLRTNWAYVNSMDEYIPFDRTERSSDSQLAFNKELDRFVQLNFKYGLKKFFDTFVT